MLILNETIKIISYRELIWKLAINQIKVKYRYPILGFFWPILTPLFLAFIFLFAFNMLMKVKIPNYPFLVYVLSAMFPWNYFSSSLMESTNSLIQGSNLLKNVSFCREVIPISAILSNLINFLFTLPVLFIFILIFKVKLSIYIIFLPFILILQTTFIVGVSLITSAYQVHVRDTKYIVEILVTALFYLTPAFYSLDLVKNISPQFLRLYMLNPLAAITILYRITILGDYIKYLPQEINFLNLVILPIVLSLCLLYLGFYIFNKFEPTFADFI